MSELSKIKFYQVDKLSELKKDLHKSRRWEVTKSILLEKFEKKAEKIKETAKRIDTLLTTNSR